MPLKRMHLYSYQQGLKLLIALTHQADAFPSKVPPMTIGVINYAIIFLIHQIVHFTKPRISSKIVWDHVQIMPDKLCTFSTEICLYSPSNNIAHVLVTTTVIFLETMTKANIIDPANSISSFDQMVLHVLVILPPRSLEIHNKLPHGIRSSKF